MGKMPFDVMVNGFMLPSQFSPITFDVPKNTAITNTVTVNAPLLLHCSSPTITNSRGYIIYYRVDPTFSQEICDFQKLYRVSNK